MAPWLDLPLYQDRRWKSHDLLASLAARKNLSRHCDEWFKQVDSESGVLAGQREFAASMGGTLVRRFFGTHDMGRLGGNPLRISARKLAQRSARSWKRGKIGQ